MDSGRSSITSLLTRMRDGEPEASSELLESLYDELRALAQSKLRHERSAHTLQATALVHEMWVSVISDREQGFADRKHFFATASRAMRRILVDAARRRRAQKRGGAGRTRLELDEALLVDESAAAHILSVEETLRLLEAEDPRKGEIVRLRYFGGLSNAETAAAMDLSISTVEREWRYIRARLLRDFDELKED